MFQVDVHNFFEKVINKNEIVSVLKCKHTITNWENIKIGD
jgi:hypothetical protein